MEEYDKIKQRKKMSNFKKPTMVRIQNSLSIDMIKIPNKNYEMGKYAVSIGEYMHFAKNNEKHLPEWKEELGHYKNMNLTDNAPIIGVSWHDAVAYCNWLNEQQKVYVYRLPTESEWEYACRAGKDTTWSFGNDEKELDKYAWYHKNSYILGKEHKYYGTHKVGRKRPSLWGLYDMHGHVWEWCNSDKDIKKMLRGGSWQSSAYDLSSDYGNDWNPNYQDNDIGFRILRVSA